MTATSALLRRFTDAAGHKAIRATPTWCFRAGQPPGNHPFGAYFTNLPRETVNLAQKLRIPKAKTEYVFEFVDVDDLRRLPGGRGVYILYSVADYEVELARQKYEGLA